MGWGESRQDRRGAIVADWIGMENLVIFNIGDTPTFKRGMQHSILDLTLGSEGIAPKIEKWQVLDDVETLSLHQYIQFEIKESDNHGEQADSQMIKGWKVKSLDKEKPRHTIREMEITDEVSLTEKATIACDSAMKRIGGEKKERSILVE